MTMTDTGVKPIPAYAPPEGGKPRNAVDEKWMRLHRAIPNSTSGRRNSNRSPRTGSTSTPPSQSRKTLKTSIFGCASPLLVLYLVTLAIQITSHTASILLDMTATEPTTAVLPTWRQKGEGPIGGPGMDPAAMRGMRWTWHGTTSPGIPLPGWPILSGLRGPLGIRHGRRIRCI